MRISREQYLLNRRRFRWVMDYLEHHLDDDDIRLDRLAEVANLSRFHFQRMYMDRVMETPMATVRRLRLQRARQLLVEGTASSITALAADSGYGSVAAFSRAFSRAFQYPPTDLFNITPEARRAYSLEPTLKIVNLSAIPVYRHPFTGRAADVFGAGDEFSWVVACSPALPRSWRHWAVHPDGWVDPVRFPDKWVRMWHCAPMEGLPSAVAGVEHGYLPPGFYARFVMRGKSPVDFEHLCARVAAETPWLVVEGPMIRHYPNIPDYTPISERITHFFLSVARR